MALEEEVITQNITPLAVGLLLDRPDQHQVEDLAEAEVAPQDMAPGVVMLEVEVEVATVH